MLVGHVCRHCILKGLGLVHAISHMIGAEYDTQHGLTNAIVLPTVLHFNLLGQDEGTAYGRSHGVNRPVKRWIYEQD